MKGVQSQPVVVSEFANRLQKLLLEAEAAGVVLEVRLQPKLPLAMSNFDMVGEARPAWRNQ